jgi:serine/threonine-protein kinase
MRLLRPALIVAVVVATSPAVADPAQAKALFDEGKVLFAEGRYGDACKKLAASFALQPLSGTSGLLGACYEKIGRLASAWNAYRDAASIAERQGNADRAKISRDNAAALAPRLARITIDASAVLATPGAVVAIDGVAQPAEALASEIPVDAGPHSIAATASDHRRQEKTFDIADGEKQSIVLDALVEDPTERLAAEARAKERRQKIRRRKLLGLSLVGAGGA